jgi:hypothetical protein
MTTQSEHERISELLGAYAVDATAGSECAEIEAHLAHCDACQRELDDMRAVTGLMASSEAITMPDLWARVEGEINTGSVDAPPLHLPRSSRRGRIGRAVLAAAAAIVVITGAFFAGAAYDNDDEAPTPQPSLLAEQAQSATTTEGARVVSLASNVDSSVTAKVVLLPDGRGFVYDSTLPSLPAGRTYQLWVVVHNTPISAGVLGDTVSAVPFAAAGPVTAFAITEEIDGGVVASSHQPVVAGAVTA